MMTLVYASLRNLIFANGFLNNIVASVSVLLLLTETFRMGVRKAHQRQRLMVKSNKKSSPTTKRLMEFTNAWRFAGLMEFTNDFVLWAGK